jgi:hypothetical protein
MKPRNYGLLSPLVLCTSLACGQDPETGDTLLPTTPAESAFLASGPVATEPESNTGMPSQAPLTIPSTGITPTMLATPISGEEMPTPQTSGTGIDTTESPMPEGSTETPVSDGAGLGETPDAGVTETPTSDGELPGTETPDTGEQPPPDTSESPEPSAPTPPDPTQPPLAFSGPEGTIPNDAQPSSVVNVDQGSWAQGLVSPSFLEGHQINQPAVINGYMLITGNEEFWFYDVSDPSAPEELSSFSTPNRRVGGEAESHTLSFARRGDNYFLATVSGTGIDTWDVTDVLNPQHLGHLTIAGVNYGDYTEAVWGVAWQGQYIYVGATNNGVKVVDASNPAALSLAGEISPSQYGGVSAGPLEAVGNVLVVMTPKESGGVATLDITDPTNPTRLASFSAGKSYIGQFYRRYAFLISPLRAWDVLSDPRNIGAGSSPIGQMNHGGAEYLSFSDDRLFLGMVRADIGGTPGTDIFDISDPRSMQEVRHVWGRQDRGGLNDDQFNIAFGNLVVMGDDQSPYAGWVIGAFAEEPDTIPPEVDTVIPKDGTTVPASSRIGVSLSDNVELATVNAASFTVRPVGGAPLSGTYGSRMGVLNFDPDEDLAAGTYEVVLPAGGVTDLVGNALATEWKSTFTVE